MVVGGGGGSAGGEDARGEGGVGGLELGEEEVEGWVRDELRMVVVVVVEY